MSTTRCDSSPVPIFGCAPTCPRHYSSQPRRSTRGGELLIEDTYGAQRVKLPAGDMVLYPAGSVHRVEPVTRGARLASFFWVQSMVRDTTERGLLFELDTAVRELTQAGAAQASLVRLTSLYHNLVRRWGDL